MRVVVHVLGADGHFLPMVPLARGLEAAGHDVAFAIDRSYADLVDARGFEALPLDRPIDMVGNDAVVEVAARPGLEGLRYAVAGFLEAAVSTPAELSSSPSRNPRMS